MKSETGGLKFFKALCSLPFKDCISGRREVKSYLLEKGKSECFKKREVIPVKSGCCSGFIGLENKPDECMKYWL